MFVTKKHFAESHKLRHFGKVFKYDSKKLTIRGMLYVASGVCR